jgi:hypothetical protein
VVSGGVKGRRRLGIKNIWPSVRSLLVGPAILYTISRCSRAGNTIT